MNESTKLRIILSGSTDLASQFAASLPNHEVVVASERVDHEALIRGYPLFNVSNYVGLDRTLPESEYDVDDLHVGSDMDIPKVHECHFDPMAVHFDDLFRCALSDDFPHFKPPRHHDHLLPGHPTRPGKQVRTANYSRQNMNGKKK
jgi:hypothetical protein